MHGGKARQPVKWGKKICDGVTRFWQKLARALGPGPGPCASFFKNLARPSHICLPHLAGWLARPPCIWAPIMYLGSPPCIRIMEFINRDSWVIRYSTLFDDVQTLFDNIQTVFDGLRLYSNGLRRSSTIFTEIVTR